MPRYFQFLPTLTLPQMLLGNALTLNPSVQVKFAGEEWESVPNWRKGLAEVYRGVLAPSGGQITGCVFFLDWKNGIEI